MDGLNLVNRIISKGVKYIMTHKIRQETIDFIKLKYHDDFNFDEHMIFEFEVFELNDIYHELRDKLSHLNNYGDRYIDRFFDIWKIEENFFVVVTRS